MLKQTKKNLRKYKRKRNTDMKHTKNISIARPAKAEILETQQKATVAAAIIAAFNSLAGALTNWRTFLDGFNDEE
jgi:hypothetical protein